MGRYTAAVCRLCRREGMKLYLKGEKCYTEKCPVHKRPTPPGMHGARPTRRKASEFGMRLREKQELRRLPGSGGRAAAQRPLKEADAPAHEQLIVEYYSR